MLEAVCCARKLIKRLGYFQPTAPGFAKGWLGSTELCSVLNNSLGIPYPCSIKSFELPDEALAETQLMSYVKIGQNKEVQIFVNNANNHCWKRYFICKEIIHVIASKKENATLGFARINDVIERLQAENMLPGSLTDPAYAIEIDAEFGAIELLMPKELVEQCDVIAKGRGGYSEQLISEIAKKYKVPALLVKWRLTNNTFRKAFDECYHDHKYKNVEFIPIYGT